MQSLLDICCDIYVIYIYFLKLKNTYKTNKRYIDSTKKYTDRSNYFSDISSNETKKKVTF